MSRTLSRGVSAADIDPGRITITAQQATSKAARLRINIMWKPRDLVEWDRQSSTDERGDQSAARAAFSICYMRINHSNRCLVMKSEPDRSPVVCVFSKSEDASHSTTEQCAG